MAFDFDEDLGGLQQDACIRQLGFRICIAPADRIDLPADLKAADIGACLVGRYFVFEREPDAGAVRDFETLGIVHRHQIGQRAS